MGEDNCHPTFANCTDIVGGSGSFECTCITGYTGDGVSCTGMGMCTIVMLAQLLLALISVLGIVIVQKMLSANAMMGPLLACVPVDTVVMV